MIHIWQFILFIVYGNPIFFVYIFVIKQMIFKKEFKAYFFKIATVMGIVDITIYISIWIQMKLPWSSVTGFWFKNNSEEKLPWNHLLLINYFISYYFPRVRELLVLASAFNRFTALSIPHKQNQFWKTCFILIIGFCWLFPLLISFLLLTGKLRILPFYEPPHEIDIYVIDVELIWFPIPNSMINAIHALIAASLSLICNFMTLVILYKRNQQRKKQQIGNFIFPFSNKTERNLLIISLWDFLLYLIYTVHQLVMYSFVLRKDLYNAIFDQIYILMPWIFDLVHLSRPILLILMCKKMQILFIHAIKRRFLLHLSAGELITVVVSSPIVH